MHPRPTHAPADAAAFDPAAAPAPAVDLNALLATLTAVVAQNRGAQERAAGEHADLFRLLGANMERSARAARQRTSADKALQALPKLNGGGAKWIGFRQSFESLCIMYALDDEEAADLLAQACAPLFHN